MRPVEHRLFLQEMEGKFTFFSRRWRPFPPGDGGENNTKRKHDQSKQSQCPNGEGHGANKQCRPAYARTFGGHEKRLSVIRERKIGNFMW